MLRFTTLAFVGLVCLQIASTQNDSPLLGDGFDFAADYEGVIGKVRYDFSCDDRPYGYYADQYHDCKVFHVCSPFATGTGRPLRTLTFSFFCPNQTRFSQDSKTCIAEDLAYPCDQAHTLYNENYKIGHYTPRTRTRTRPNVTELDEVIEDHTPSAFANRTKSFFSSHRFRVKAVDETDGTTLLRDSPEIEVGSSLTPTTDQSMPQIIPDTLSTGTDNSDDSFSTTKETLRASNQRKSPESSLPKSHIPPISGSVLPPSLHKHLPGKNNLNNFQQRRPHTSLPSHSRSQEFATSAIKVSKDHHETGKSESGSLFKSSRTFSRHSSFQTSGVRATKKPLDIHSNSQELGFSSHSKIPGVNPTSQVLGDPSGSKINSPSRISGTSTSSQASGIDSTSQISVTGISSQRPGTDLHPPKTVIRAGPKTSRIEHASQITGTGASSKEIGLTTHTSDIHTSSKISSIDRPSQTSNIDTSSKISGIDSTSQIIDLGITPKISGINSPSQFTGISQGSKTSAIDSLSQITGIHTSSRNSGIDLTFQNAKIPSISRTSEVHFSSRNLGSHSPSEVPIRKSTSENEKQSGLKPKFGRTSIGTNNDQFQKDNQHLSRKHFDRTITDSSALNAKSETDFVSHTKQTRLTSNKPSPVVQFTGRIGSEKTTAQSQADDSNFSQNVRLGGIQHSSKRLNDKLVLSQFNQNLILTGNIIPPTNEHPSSSFSNSKQPQLIQRHRQRAQTLPQGEQIQMKIKKTGSTSQKSKDKPLQSNRNIPSRTRSRTHSNNIDTTAKVTSKPSPVVQFSGQIGAQRTTIPTLQPTVSHRKPSSHQHAKQDQSHRISSTRSNKNIIDIDEELVLSGKIIPPTFTPAQRSSPKPSPVVQFTSHIGGSRTRTQLRPAVEKVQLHSKLTSVKAEKGSSFESNEIDVDEELILSGKIVPPKTHPVQKVTGKHPPKMQFNRTISNANIRTQSSSPVKTHSITRVRRPFTDSSDLSRGVSHVATTNDRTRTSTKIEVSKQPISTTETTANDVSPSHLQTISEIKRNRVLTQKVPVSIQISEQEKLKKSHLSHNQANLFRTFNRQLTKSEEELVHSGKIIPPSLAIKTDTRSSSQKIPPVQFSGRIGSSKIRTRVSKIRPPTRVRRPLNTNILENDSSSAASDGKTSPNFKLAVEHRLTSQPAVGSTDTGKDTISKSVGLSLKDSIDITDNSKLGFSRQNSRFQPKSDFPTPTSGQPTGPTHGQTRARVTGSRTEIHIRDSKTEDHPTISDTIHVDDNFSVQNENKLNSMQTGSEGLRENTGSDSGQQSETSTHQSEGRRRLISQNGGITSQSTRLRSGSRRGSIRTSQRIGSTQRGQQRFKSVNKIVKQITEDRTAVPAIDIPTTTPRPIPTNRGNKKFVPNPLFLQNFVFESQRIDSPTQFVSRGRNRFRNVDLQTATSKPIVTSSPVRSRNRVRQRVNVARTKPTIVTQTNVLGRIEENSFDSFDVEPKQDDRRISSSATKPSPKPSVVHEKETTQFQEDSAKTKPTPVNEQDHIPQNRKVHMQPNLSTHEIKEGVTSGGSEPRLLRRKKVKSIKRVVLAKKTPIDSSNLPQSISPTTSTISINDKIVPPSSTILPNDSPHSEADSLGNERIRSTKNDKKGAGQRTRKVISSRRQLISRTQTNQSTQNLDTSQQLAPILTEVKEQIEETPQNLSTTVNSRRGSSRFSLKRLRNQRQKQPPNQPVPEESPTTEVDGIVYRRPQDRFVDVKVRKTPVIIKTDEKKSSRDVEITEPATNIPRPRGTGRGSRTFASQRRVRPVPQDIQNLPASGVIEGSVNSETVSEKSLSNVGNQGEGLGNRQTIRNLGARRRGGRRISNSRGRRPVIADDKLEAIRDQSVVKASIKEEIVETTTEENIKTGQIKTKISQATPENRRVNVRRRVVKKVVPLELKVVGTSVKSSITKSTGEQTNNDSTLTELELEALGALSQSSQVPSSTRNGAIRVIRRRVIKRQPT